MKNERLDIVKVFSQFPYCLIRWDSPALYYDTSVSVRFQLSFLHACLLFQLIWEEEGLDWVFYHCFFFYLSEYELYLSLYVCRFLSEYVNANGQTGGAYQKMPKG